MPSTPTLLYHILADALRHSKAFEGDLGELDSILQHASRHIGFEITLNDLWQICRQATALLYESFATLEKDCIPNRVHTFLAYWLSNGGIVVTTNYDRLIEREWGKIGQPIQSRFREEGANSFAGWQKDLARGSCLFKIHGSLDDPESCLGALEHVGTQLAGHRAELLAEIVRTRPLCFVGWRGVDPDIPPFLNQAWSTRDPSLPVFWMHHEGVPAGSLSLEKAIQGTPQSIRPYASNKPILTDADRAFGEMLDWVGHCSAPNPDKPVARFDFSDTVAHCSRSGVTRMVGIALRRAGQYDTAVKILDAALELSGAPEERALILQEMALLQQQRTGKNTDKSRMYLSRAREALGAKPDPWLLVNIDFGLLSMTIVALKLRPWLLFMLPKLFRKYQCDIDYLQQETMDKESVALHTSMRNLYLGRFRYKTLGWLAVGIQPLADWILEPFHLARASISEAKDIDLHGRIDVLAYRAITLAQLHRCQEARQDLLEIDRFIAVLNDDARSRHWKKQRSEIERRCQLFDRCASQKNDINQ